MGLLSRALNRNLLGKGKYEMEKEATETKVCFTTKASIADVKEALRVYVIVEDRSAITLVSHKLVIENQTDEFIKYANRNKMLANFEAVLLFSQEESLHSQFLFTHWIQNDGVAVEAEKMLNLRNAVISAFRHADPDVSITYEANK